MYDLWSRDEVMIGFLILLIEAAILFPIALAMFFAVPDYMFRLVIGVFLLGVVFAILTEKMNNP